MQEPQKRFDALCLTTAQMKCAALERCIIYLHANVSCFITQLRAGQ